MNKTIKVVILSVSLYFLQINNTYAEESNKIPNASKNANESNSKWHEKWGILFHAGFSPTLSSFCSRLNKNMDNYFPNINFGKLKRKNFKIYKGLSFSVEWIVGYKTLSWLGNQIYIKSQNATIYTGREEYKNYNFGDIDNYFKGSESRIVGTNALFYINKNFFALTGIGIKFNTDNQILNIFPVLNLGLGICTDFGLIFKLYSNLTFGLFSLKNDYISALKKGEKFQKIEKETLNLLNNTLSLDIIEISVGYNFSKLLSRFASYF